MSVKRLLLLATLALIACAPAARGQGTSSDQAQGDLPPVGYGTLNQDDIAVTIRQGDLEIRILPLDERVLRLLAPDAYASLHGIVEARSTQLDSVSRRNGVTAPGILFVTFFGRTAGARFDPENLSVAVRNQLYRPIGIIRYSDNFNAQQLDVRQSATGIFVFEERFPIFEPFTISYGAVSSGEWEGKLNRLQRERSRVMSRVRRDSTPGS
jgi:hypothetical protein